MNITLEAWMRESVRERAAAYFQLAQDMRETDPELASEYRELAGQLLQSTNA